MFSMNDPESKYKFFHMLYKMQSQKWRTNGWTEQSYGEGKSIELNRREQSITENEIQLKKDIIQRQKSGKCWDVSLHARMNKEWEVWIRRRYHLEGGVWCCCSCWWWRWWRVAGEEEQQHIEQNTNNCERRHDFAIMLLSLRWFMH